MQNECGELKFWIFRVNILTIKIQFMVSEKYFSFTIQLYFLDAHLLVSRFFLILNLEVPYTIFNYSARMGFFLAHFHVNSQNLQKMSPHINFVTPGLSGVWDQNRVNRALDLLDFDLKLRSGQGWNVLGEVEDDKNKP